MLKDKAHVNKPDTEDDVKGKIHNTMFSVSPAEF
jgi:hypothetical protein